MNFLFRAPLLDIDTKNEHEIHAHWELILQIISVSSRSLLEEISSKPYGELQPKLKKKVYKYLLRGRYRATPFGLLAGVGMGKFDDSQNFILDLKLASPIASVPNLAEECTSEKDYYYLAEGGYEKWGKIHFLSYIQNNRRWGLVSLPKNSLIDFLVEQLKECKAINFAMFHSWFEDPEAKYVKDLWGQAVELGILNSINKVTASRNNQQIRTDIVFEDEISLPNTTLSQIKEFYQNAGNLFTKAKNSFLDSFQAWFIANFDDRFVPLNLLLNYDDFINHAFLDSQTDSDDTREPADFQVNFTSLKSVDLKPLFPSKQLDAGIFDLQLAFKTLTDGTIIIENIVCNRPFVYFGRFNRDQKLFQEQRIIKETIYHNKEVLYAELKLIETEAVESICLTRQVFESYITPFPESNPMAINLKEIEIGFSGGEFMLIHKPTLKKIIPVVIHPLNGQEISHPIMRLLWEIAHQNPYTFVPYKLRKDKGIQYMPQLNWGQLVLQTQRWVINFSTYSSIAELEQWAVDNKLPHPITMGYMDRELLLHWKEKRDLEILWAELCKWERLILSEPKWINQSQFTSHRKQQIYPQFIVHKSAAKSESNPPSDINSIETTDENSLYILCRIREEECLDFLGYFYCEQLMAVLTRESIIWYYVVYPGRGHLQLRLRFLRLDPTQKSLLITLISQKLAESQVSYETRQYYPELKKYGNRNYIQSEQLFHLESRLLLSQDSKLHERLLESHLSLKIEFMTSLWMMVIKNVKSDLFYFDFLKSRIKFLSRNEMKNIRKYSGEFKNQQSFTMSYHHWMESYMKIIMSHSAIEDEKEAGLRLILNHIHMQVNRFFPMERKQMEDLVFFQLYKRLGKEIYSPYSAGSGSKEI